MQLVHMLFQQRQRLVVALVDEATGFLIDLAGDFLGIIPAVAEIPSQKDLLLVGAVDHGAQLVTEAVTADHGAGDLGGPLDIVGGAGGDILQHQLLRRTAGQQYGDLLFHPALGLEADVLFRQGKGKAARPAARDDGNLMHLILQRAVIGDDGVTGLVIGGQAALLFGDDVAALFGADDDLERRFLDILHGDGLAVLAGRQQRRLVGEVFEIRTGKAAGGTGDDRQIHIGADGLVAGMDAQDGLAALDVRIIDGDMTVKAAGAQQRRVQDILAVGSRHDDNAKIGGKAIHFHQQLVQGLLPLIVAAAETRAAVTAHGVDLIDKDDAGRALFGLLEQVANTRCADTDKHFDKIGAGDREERHPRFAGDRLGQQRFTGSGRTHEQNALGDTGAQRIELGGIPEELDDLLQLLLFLIRTGHIFEGHAVVGVLLFGLELGEGHGVASAAGALHQQIPETAHKQNGKQQRQHIQPPRHRLGRIIILLDGGVGMLFVILVYQLMGILQEQAEVRHIVGDGGLFLVVQQDRQLTGAEIQLVFRYLLIPEIIDDGAVLAFGRGGIQAEDLYRHIAEQRDQHQWEDPTSFFGRQ